jgi:hypothetical protein
VSLRLHRHAETVIGRVRGRRIRVILVSALLAMAVVTAGFPIYVAPQIDDLRHADAIFVLGGRGYERYSYGLALALRGVAPQLVVSNPAGAQDIWLTDLCEHQRYAFTATALPPRYRTILATSAGEPVCSREGTIFSLPAPRRRPPTLSRSADGRSAAVGNVPALATPRLADLCEPTRTKVNETTTETSEDHFG